MSNDKHFLDRHLFKFLLIHIAIFHLYFNMNQNVPAIFKLVMSHNLWVIIYFLKRLYNPILQDNNLFIKLGKKFFRLENWKFFAYPSTEPQNEFCSSLVLSTSNVLASYHHEIDPIWVKIGSKLTWKFTENRLYSISQKISLGWGILVFQLEKWV